ncbi:MAG: LysR family transcriptional regulator [Xanthobacter sp.]
MARGANDMNVTFRQLRYFLTLSEHLHFGRAAQILNISQPPLSASLKQLEDNLGFRLMERTNKSVRLTPAGAIFAEHAARVLGQMKSAQNIAAQISRGTRGELSIGFVPSMLFRRLPALLNSFQESYPNIELKIEEMNSRTQVQSLVNHNIDIGFVHGSSFPEGVVYTPIETERLMCCVPKGHRFARRSQISIADLSGDRVLVFARDFAPHYHDKIVGLLHAENITPHLQFRIQHWFTILVLVSQGMGVSIVPRSMSRSDFVDVVFIDIRNTTAEHEVSMIRRDETPPDVLQAFITLMREQYQLPHH